MVVCRGRHLLLRANWRFKCLLACIVLLQSGGVLAQPCDRQIGRVVAAEGGSIRYGGGSERPIDSKGPEVRVCLNSVISIKGAGRVTVELMDPSARKANNNRPLVTLGPNSSLSFRKPPQDRTWLLRLVNGWFRFFSPRPVDIDVETPPYMTAGVRGTEFVLHSQQGRCEETGEPQGCAVLWVQEGRVLVSNQSDSLEVDAADTASVRTVIARAGQSLEVRSLQITPEDAVNWVVHYLPLSGLRPPRCDADGHTDLRMALACGPPDTVLTALQGIPGSASIADRVELYGLAAGRLLAAGEVDEAEALLDKAIALSANASLLAMKSVIALKQNDKQGARAAAEQALALDTESPDALLAMSYVRQAEFDLPGAREAAHGASGYAAHDPLLAARLAELDLSLGDTATALAAAEKAVVQALDDSVWSADAIEACRFEGGTPASARDAVLSRAYTVLGFTRLIRLDVAEARGEMQRAICADDQAPMPRMGLALALIRQGELERGVRQLEIAVALDPKVSLYRTYLGKGYFEQDAYGLAQKEFRLAKAYDEKDPTPWLYQAMLEQVLNRPVKALDEMQQSVALSGYRAPYRSVESLGEDMAARHTGLARIYDDLGFNRLATLEATRALSFNPADYSAHRFLADSYRDVPRLEIARASQMLQAQLLQPLNRNPIQPSLAFSDLGIRNPGGPAIVGFNEYSSLFTRDGMSFYGTGLFGNDDKKGGEAVVAGMRGRAAFSAGLFHYETDGFRADSDLEHDIVNLFGQLEVARGSNFQFEYRSRDSESGDRRLLVDPFGFEGLNRRDIDEDILRFGGRLGLTQGLDVLVSFIDTDIDEEVMTTYPGFGDVTTVTDTDAKQFEAQALLRRESFSVIAGGGQYDSDVLDKGSSLTSNNDAWNTYAYGTYHLGSSIAVTLGMGYEKYEDSGGGWEFELDKYTPKVGVVWQPAAGVQVRAAAFRGVKRDLAVDQTIEPTTVAGFNRFVDDLNGTVSDNYHIAVDATTDDLHWGIEFATRDSSPPFLTFGPSGLTVDTNSHEEDILRGYAYWELLNNMTLSVELEYSRFEQDLQLIGPKELDTLKIPVELRYLDESGFFAGVRATYFDQDVTNSLGPISVESEDSAVLSDLVMGYRFPKRSGAVSIEVNNVFDDDFEYQDDSFRSGNQELTPPFLPSRTVVAYLSLYF